jgi:hypothetical protein
MIPGSATAVTVRASRTTNSMAFNQMRHAWPRSDICSGCSLSTVLRPTVPRAWTGTDWENHVCACALDGDPDPFLNGMVILTCMCAPYIGTPSKEKCK